MKPHDTLPPLNATSQSPLPIPTVFIVDDEPAVLKGLSRLLRSMGMAVVTFSSPRDFLDRYDSDSPGCLVLDVAMPEMTGLELQQALIAAGHEPSIVFLTGRSDIAMKQQAMKSGAVAFLSKPANDEDLLKTVRIAIEKDRLNRLTRAEAAAIR